MSLFKAEGLVKRFGALTATDDVSFTVGQNEIHALIGPNGAGKSTIVDLVSGLARADRGRIVLDGVDITRLSPHLRVRRGLSRCFQITSIFRSRTVCDNLLLAAQGFEGNDLGFWNRRDRSGGLQSRALELAGAVGLETVLDRIAGTLPHGLQRKLDIALALAGRPKMLILDEPLAGMGADDIPAILALIETLGKAMAVLLIEHDMDAVFALSHRISVLDYGRILVSGTADTIRNDAQVRAIYLGAER